MAMHINNPEVERKVRSLAETLGMSLTEAVDISVSKELRRVLPAKPDRRFMRDVQSILDRIDSLPVRDTRRNEEILGYNEQGTFD